MTKFSQKIIRAIKTNKVAPRPHWRFVLRENLLWILLGIFILVGGFFAGTLLAAIFSADYALLPRFPGGPLNFFWRFVPLTWLLLLVLFTAGVYYFFRRTEFGYRYRVPLILGGVLFLALLFGGLFNSTEFPGRLQNWHDSHMQFIHSGFLAPEEGFLFGKIMSVQGNAISLETPEGKTWQVNFEKADVKPRVRLEVGESVRVIGKKITEDRFQADFIRPGSLRRNFQPMRRMMGF